MRGGIKVNFSDKIFGLISGVPVPVRSLELLEGVGGANFSILVLCT